MKICKMTKAGKIITIAKTTHDAEQAKRILARKKDKDMYNPNDYSWVVLSDKVKINDMVSKDLLTDESL